MSPKEALQARMNAYTICVEDTVRSIESRFESGQPGVDFDRATTWVPMQREQWGAIDDIASLLRATRRSDEGLAAGRFSEPARWNRHALKRWLKRDLVKLVAGQPVVSLDKKRIYALACNLLVVVERGIDDVAE